MSKKASAAVLIEYPRQYQPKSMRSVGNAGGFSGSELWRFRTAAGQFCLRRWPSETSHSKVLTMHLVLQHVYSRGFHFVALPIANSQGQTLTVFDDSLWELTPWINGEPQLVTAYSDTYLESAVRELARFHNAASSYQPIRQASSPGLNERLDQLLSWRGNIGLAWQMVRDRNWPEFEKRARKACQLFEASAASIEYELRRYSAMQLPLQFCIRDARAEHFLFSGDQVTGIIDFGAMRVESVAGDIARLVGTAPPPTAPKWNVARRAYSEQRKISDDELELTQVFHSSGVMLATMNWIRWIAMEDREFDNWDAVLARMDALLEQWEQERFPAS